MKLFKLPITIALLFVWSAIAISPVRSQSGNMSDVTMPNPGEMPPDTEGGVSSEGDGATDEPVAGEDSEPTTDEPVAGEDSDTTTDEPVAGEDSDTTTDEPVAGEDSDTTTDEPVAGEDSDTTTDEPVAGEDSETPGETPMEESIVDNGDTDGETSGNDEIVDNSGDEQTIADDSDTEDRNIANENVMEAIADDDGVSEPEVVSNEDELGVTVNESATVDAPADTVETTEPSVNPDSANPSEVETLDTATVEDTTTTDNPTTLEDADTTTATEDTTTTDDSASENNLEEVAEELETEGTTAEKTEAARETSESEEVAEETEADTEETAEETEETEDETAEAKDDSSDLVQEVDRLAYEVQVQEAPTDLAIQMQEEFQLTQLMGTSGLQLYGQVPSVKDISKRLAELGQQTGKKPAFVNISLQSDRLEAFVVLPDRLTANRDHALVATTDLNKIDSTNAAQALTIRETVKDTSRKDLVATATQFREEISDSSKLDRDNYLQSSQELYKVLIEPIEAQLEANDIDILVFSMDSGLRLLPLAALHDGKQFLIEKYALAIVPSFGLTDTRYVSLDQSSILAMGASEFNDQAALPTMPIELETIVSQPRHGEVFINEQFTLDNFKAQNRRETPFPIVHLGTHAEFKAGSLDDSYIQFYDDKLKIPQLQELSNELGWNSDATPIELLVLSACETALGDEQAELGFAGLAVQAGVKSALASLWYVSDIGTLALMGEFYDQLGTTLIKAEALRQTQLKMLAGNVKVNNKQVELSNGQSLDLPPEFPAGTLTLDHPYFWSSFTLIGNWN